jgi:hypothetical protein
MANRLPGIPRVPAGLPREHERFLFALKEAVEVNAGQRGSAQDSAVTERKLEALVKPLVEKYAKAAVSVASQTDEPDLTPEDTDDTLDTDDVLELLVGALTEEHLSEELLETLSADVDLGENIVERLDAMDEQINVLQTVTRIEQDLGSTATWRGKFTVTDDTVTADSHIAIWQASAALTGKGTRADENEMDYLSVTAEPGSGSFTVRWQTPPLLTPAGLRLGKVRGNFKFDYMVY